MIDKLISLTEVFNKRSIKYLFIGKGAAILYGYTGTTQDIDIFPKRSEENCKNIVEALKELGFNMDKELEGAIVAGKDFIQIRGGPFPIDIIFAPDGIESFSEAEKHKTLIGDRFPCASIEDIIESKKAAKRQRDMEELPRLQAFRDELRKRK
ncbi:MAG: hypothetical protein SCARUB_00261 [Candidatus Scalindua rubra]|uniref:Nucleotidyltransferase n=1 Tax=Candidatus Scalindua rubra TaxID=1872076 RepID=A0A1E3XFU8_9BACT|nr:MAG: hypothetical protein SCARUB_00261 [Candidatus Scalindua rubra]